MSGEEKMNMGSVTSELIGGCCREKYWKELSDTEKIERLRTVLKRKESSIEALDKIVGNLIRLFEEHIHLDGKRVMPINSRNLSGICDREKSYVSKDQEAKGEVYF
jgi:hypothetical protein